MADDSVPRREPAVASWATARYSSDRGRALAGPQEHGGAVGRRRAPISWPDRRAGEHDAGRHRHGPLQREAGVGRAPQVEHDRGGARPGLLVLAHDQLAGPGRGAPVDVAQVVAGHVLPQAAEAVAARGLDHLAVADRGRLLLAARGRR